MRTCTRWAAAAVVAALCVLTGATTAVAAASPGGSAGPVDKLPLVGPLVAGLGTGL